MRSAAGERLRLVQSIEGELPERLGRYRAHLYHFDLDGGASLTFMDMANSEGRFFPGRAHVKRNLSRTFTSWNGFDVATIHSNHLYQSDHIDHRPFHIPLIIEIDRTRGGTISVDRNRLEIDDHTLVGIEYIWGKVIKRMCLDFISDHQSSKFATINRTVIARYFGSEHLSAPVAFCAAMRDFGVMGDKFRWDTLEFPAVELGDDSSAGLEKSLTWNGQQISVFSTLKEPGYESSLSVSELIPCDRCVCVLQRWGLRVLPLWERRPQSERRSVPWLTVFPDEWLSIALISSKHRRFWNRNYASVKAIARDDWLWARKHRDDVRAIANSPSNPSRAAGWALENLARPDRFWNGLRDQVPDVFASLISALTDPLERKGQKEVYALVFDRRFPGSSEAMILSERGALTIEHPWLVVPAGMALLDSSYAVSGLRLGDDVTLDVPSDPEWWLEFASDEDQEKAPA